MISVISTNQAINKSRFMYLKSEKKLKLFYYALPPHYNQNNRGLSNNFNVRTRKSQNFVWLKSLCICTAVITTRRIPPENGAKQWWLFDKKSKLEKKKKKILATRIRIESSFNAVNILLFSHTLWGGKRWFLKRFNYLLGD